MATVLGRAQTGSPGGNSDCAQWCAANFANPGKDCTSLAAKGTGPCYVCGPLKTTPTEQLCSGACSDTSSDNNNCGACGTKVSTFETRDLLSDAVLMWRFDLSVLLAHHANQAPASAAILASRHVVEPVPTCSLTLTTVGIVARRSA